MNNNKNELPIEIKNNLWNKIKKKLEKILNIFRKNNASIKQYKENEYENNTNSEISNQNNKSIITSKIEKDINPIIKKAQIAHKSYILSSNPDIGNDLYNLVKQRIIANEDIIKDLIKINDSPITFLQILELLNDEQNTLKQYKKARMTKKIDNRFIFSQYQVSVGIIGIVTRDVNEVIKNIFKSITTRNSIVIIQDNYNEHSVENLVLLIVHEALKKLELDENIIQIVSKTQIENKDIESFDMFLGKNRIINKKKYNKKMYIYEEDSSFDNIVNEEIKKLKLSGKSIELIKGSFEDAVNKVNESNNYAVSIYTKDRKKAYEFINRVKSKNVFFNSTLQNACEVEECRNVFFDMKNIACEYAWK